ncbi:MAG: diphthamide biosynthesis enzyme Dph2 [Candidatus Micrarchaeia archaeon]
MRILLQFPEGLKNEALKEADKLEKEGHEVFVSSSPCYGACDVAVDEARKIGADKIIHFGHSKFMEIPGVPIEYIEHFVEVDFKPVIERALAELKEAKTIVLATTVQHARQVGEMKRFLENKGKVVLISKGRLAPYPGQVLGCDDGAVASVAEKADAILFFGGGAFHPLGIKAGGKPVIACDPFSGMVRRLNAELARLERRRRAMFSKASEAKTFGILVSTKPGQYNMGIARKVKEALEKAGRRATILVSNEINFLSLENFRSFDCYVNTACPRLWEDFELAKKPILNAEDALGLAALLKR